MPDTDLISRATALLCPRRLSPTVEAGGVGCALVSAKGVIHVGVCVDVACGLGFCAECAAIAAMVTHGESRINTIVAVKWDGTVLPPCGRCRELICQVDVGNIETRVLLPNGSHTTLRDLLPNHWLIDANNPAPWRPGLPSP
jgi:cytidine deaminase